MTEIVSVRSITDEMGSDDQADNDAATYSKVPTSQYQQQRQIQNKQNSKQDTCTLCLYFCCEINCCSKMMGSKYAEQLRSFSFFINFFAVVLLGFAMGINELTSTQCGWNMDKEANKSFGDLCSDDDENGYCEAESVGFVWLIGNIIALVLNITAAMVNCQYDKYASDVENNKRTNNPLPRNCAAYMNLITGIIIILSNIIFEYGQDVCDNGASNWGSSLISTYAAGAILLTFGFWIFPLAIMVCIFA